MEKKLRNVDEELTLAKSLRLLIRASWSDSQSIQQITKLLCTTTPIWKSFETILGDQTDEFFVQCLDTLKRQNLKAKDAFLDLQTEHLGNLEKAVLPKLLEEVTRRAERDREDAKDGILEEKINAAVPG